MGRLGPGRHLVDVGCGCGQLAAALDKDFEGSYLGTHIVPELIDYARRRTSPRFQFAVVDDLTIPMGDAQADMVCLFSVLTHLHHDESFHLLREAARVLRPGGAIVATHLEFSVACLFTAFSLPMPNWTTPCTSTPSLRHQSSMHGHPTSAWSQKTMFALACLPPVDSHSWYFENSERADSRQRCEGRSMIGQPERSRPY